MSSQDLRGAPAASVVFLGSGFSPPVTSERSNSRLAPGVVSAGGVLSPPPDAAPSGSWARDTFATPRLARITKRPRASRFMRFLAWGLPSPHDKNRFDFRGLAMKAELRAM